MQTRSARRSTHYRVPLGLLLGALVATGAAAEEATDPSLEERLEAVIRQNQALQEEVRGLRDEVQGARDEARAAREMARARPDPAQPGEAALFSRSLGGGTSLQLLDISADVLTTAGFSTVEDETLEVLQGGGHDPRRRGFNLPSIELSLMGAVDPWFTGEVHLLYFLDPEGESAFEVEEAFATTSRLPFGLEEHGLQLEFGHMLTEFGRINPRHVHSWHWQDQPIVNTRFFGADGLRAPGVRAGWLMPLPWFSELHVGMQNPQGETMVSFLANDEVFEERPIGGRPFAGTGTRGLGDFVYLARWVNGVDLSDTWTAQVGVSGLYGPNATGSDANTAIYGLDAVLKWLPLRSDRGFPFLTIEGEIMGRRYEADDFRGCVEEEDCDDPLFLDDDVLDDWGGYLQALWGFRRGWAVGLRGEYATGDGASVGPFGSRSEDPFRDDRWRVSPLLAWYPSEFSRVRFQYNYDRADFLDEGDAHTLWVGLEFLFGSHPAHRF